MIIDFFVNLGKILIGILRKMIPLTIQQKSLNSWYSSKGDKTLRLDYELDLNSIVFDLGGYEGDWTKEIFARYCCKIHVFEPVKIFYENINKVFQKNENIFVHNFGLSDGNKFGKIALQQNGSSIYKDSALKETIQLVKAMDFMDENNIKKIDLMKINIEGGEYDLLEHLIGSGFIKNIRDIQIQFHNCFPDAETRMNSIQEKLKLTHRLTYQYLFVWENWRLKG